GCTPDTGKRTAAADASTQRTSSGSSPAGAVLDRQRRAPATSESLAPNPGRVVFADAGVFAKCHSGFTSGGDPTLDVMRLGLMCGPSNGMKLLLDVASDLAALPERHTLEVRAGDCFRVIAAASRAVAGLRVEVTAADERVVARGAAPSWLILDSEYPFCSSEAGTYRVAVSASSAPDAGAAPVNSRTAAYALQVWRLRL
ncbi:MAG TPA: hypothetical protein VK524_16850, partial [Polyangiaceae bacterium]|nr:hypothetical protein [Polyangiaceae bacterium]